LVEIDVQHTGPGFSAGDNYSGSDNVLGGQLIGGARVKLFSGPISLFVEYRYQRAQNARVGGHTVEYESSSFAGGARWTF